jgi:hypothetical protein
MVREAHRRTTAGSTAGQQLETNTHRALSELQDLPGVGGVLVEGVSLTSGANTVRHGLGYKPTGWYVVRKQAARSAAGTISDYRDQVRLAQFDVTRVIYDDNLTSVGTSLPNAPTAGSLLVAFITHTEPHNSDSSGVSSSSGAWTKLARYTNTGTNPGIAVQIWYLQNAAAADVTVTSTWATRFTGNQWVVELLNGKTSGTPGAVIASVNSGSSVDVTPGTGTISQDNAYILAAFGKRESPAGKSYAANSGLQVLDFRDWFTTTASGNRHSGGIAGGFSPYSKAPVYDIKLGGGPSVKIEGAITEWYSAGALPSQTIYGVPTLAETARSTTDLTIDCDGTCTVDLWVY